MPSTPDLQEAVLQSISALGGEATNSEIYSWTISNMKISEDVLKIMHSGNRTEIEYRLAWARTKARKSGLIHRSAPSTWSLGAE